MLPDAPILAFDTSAAHCAAALLWRGTVVAAAHEDMAKGQAERLMPLLQALLDQSRLAWTDLGAIAVGVGPGNFTGIRIAVSTARGLALGLGKPAIGVTQFEALALDLPRPLLVVEDARRGAVYVQGFGTGPELAQLMPLGELGAMAKGAMVVGSGAGLLPQAHSLTPRYALPEAIARVAAQRHGVQPRPAPFYLRPADAAPPSDAPPIILDALP